MAIHTKEDTEAYLTRLYSQDERKVLEQFAGALREMESVEWQSGGELAVPDMPRLTIPLRSRRQGELVKYVVEHVSEVAHVLERVLRADGPQSKDLAEVLHDLRLASQDFRKEKMQLLRTRGLIEG